MMWSLLLASVAALVFLLLAGVLFQFLGDARDARKYRPPGSLVDVGGRRMHLWCRGSGRPTVVFDSALGATCLSWMLVQPRVAEFARACAYDRVGFGWSDPGPLPRSVDRIVENLHRLLEKARVPGPYVLVGHSYGGLTVRLFAARYREEVAGLVLVDAADVRQWVEPRGEDRRKIEGGARLSRRGEWIARLGVARLVAFLVRIGAIRAAGWSASLLSEGATTRVRDRVMSPVERLPDDVRPALRWFWTRPSFYRALAGQIESVPESAALVDACGGLGDLPLVVLSADNPDPSWTEKQAETSRLSRRGRHVHLAGCGHWIPLERPDAVVEAVREVVEMARAGS